MPPKVPDNMQYEDKRLETFSKSIKISGSSQMKYWANDRPDKLKLAINGFFFTPSRIHTDQVTCVCCSKREHNINGIDDIVEYHLSNNPNCPLSIIISSHASYINAHNPDDFWSNQPDTRLSEPLSKESVELRKKTFRDFWNLDGSSSSSATSKSLASAGFYYAPAEVARDRVFCMYCGCTLEGWDEHDDPVMEHTKAGNKSCYFISKYNQSQKKYKRKKSSSVSLTRRKQPTHPRTTFNKSASSEGKFHEVSSLSNDTTADSSLQKWDDDFKLEKGTPIRTQNDKPISDTNTAAISATAQLTIMPPEKGKSGMHSDTSTIDPKPRRSRRIQNMEIANSSFKKVILDVSSKSASVKKNEPRSTSITSSGNPSNESSALIAHSVSTEDDQPMKHMNKKLLETQIVNYHNELDSKFFPRNGQQERKQETLAQSRDRQRENSPVPSFSFSDEKIENPDLSQEYLPDSTTGNYTLSPRVLRTDNKKKKEQPKQDEKMSRRRTRNKKLQSSLVDSQEKIFRDAPQDDLLIPASVEESNVIDHEPQSRSEGAKIKAGKKQSTQSKNIRVKGNSTTKSNKNTQVLDDTKKSGSKRYHDTDERNKEENQLLERKQPKRKKLRILRTAYSPSPDFFDLSNQNIGDYDEMHVDFHERDIKPRAHLSPKKAQQDKSQSYKQDTTAIPQHVSSGLKRVSKNKRGNQRVSARKSSGSSHRLPGTDETVFDTKKNVAAEFGPTNKLPADPIEGTEYSSKSNLSDSDKRPLHAAKEGIKFEDELVMLRGELDHTTGMLHHNMEPYFGDAHQEIATGHTPSSDDRGAGDISCVHPNEQTDKDYVGLGQHATRTERKQSLHENNNGLESSTGDNDANNWLENADSHLTKNQSLREITDSIPAEEDYASASENFLSPIPDLLPSNISGSTDIDIVHDQQNTAKDILSNNFERPHFGGNDTPKNYLEPLTIVNDSDSGEEAIEGPKRMIEMKKLDGADGERLKTSTNKQTSGRLLSPDSPRILSDSNSLSPSVYEEYIQGVNDFSKKSSKIEEPKDHEIWSSLGRDATRRDFEFSDDDGVRPRSAAITNSPHHSVIDTKPDEKEESHSNFKGYESSDTKHEHDSLSCSANSLKVLKAGQKDHEEANTEIVISSNKTIEPAETLDDLSDMVSSEKDHKDEDNIATKEKRSLRDLKGALPHSKPYTIQNFEEELQTMSDTVRYLENLPTSDYGLYNDIEGVITDFIAAMPEEEEDMTIEEWIRHNASSCADTVRKHSKDMIDSYMSMCDEMIKLVESLPER